MINWDTYTNTDLLAVDDTTLGTVDLQNWREALNARELDVPLYISASRDDAHESSQVQQIRQRFRPPLRRARP